MSVDYVPVLWNRQKKRYDWALACLMILYCGVYLGLTLAWYPEITAETLIIRTTGTLAFLLLHVILVIGPLSRIDRRFLPLLYNRRHLGVMTFFIALMHGAFNLIQFHSLGNVDPIYSLFGSNQDYLAWSQFPFQILGFFALLILAIMAATSHDFWLNLLSARIWKALHMMVYLAYLLLVLHVLLGIVQSEASLTGLTSLVLGVVTVTVLHLWASLRPRADIPSQASQGVPWMPVAHVDDFEADRAKTLLIDSENIAIFRYDNKVSAVSNICKHQNGPLGEGKIVDGCITCPWHGYQYYPHNGQSPPPFSEQIATYQVKIVEQVVYVHPVPQAEGTACEPATITPEDES